jgi:hypothetical protein
VNPNQAVDAYPDVFGDEDDAATSKLVVNLATIYRGAGTPIALRKSLNAALIKSVTKEPGAVTGRTRRQRLGFRTGALIAAAALVLIVGVVGYAVAPLIDQLLATERGVATLPMQNIGQAQSANGVTVKLERAYADVNRIIVAYTVQVPAGFANSTSGIDGKISLTDDQGVAFPVIEGQGVDGNQPPHVGAGLVTFDAESLAPDTANVSLRLTLPDVRAKAEKAGGSDLAAGAFAFKFTVPVMPGRVVAVNRTTVANGVPVTLERVVVTPSETRAYMRFPASSGIDASDWIADAHISGAGWNSRQLPAGFSGEMTLGSMFMNSGGEHVTTFSGDYRGRHGEWSLTVDALSGVDTKAPSSEGGLPKQARIAGPWIFKLSLP